MGPLGIPELIVIFAVLVLICGPSKLPKLGGALGESIKNFKKGLSGNSGDTPAITAKEADKREEPKKIETP